MRKEARGWGFPTLPPRSPPRDSAASGRTDGRLDGRTDRPTSDQRMAPASSPRPPRLLLLVVMMMMMMMTDPAVPLPHARETPGRAPEEEEDEDDEDEEEEEEGWASGTAARDFSCVLYDAAFLNCSWRPGRAAPRDVQYFLFTASHRDRRRERECPQYVTQEEAAAAAAPGGLHTGCHVRDLSAFGSLNYFRVNGSSAGGRGTIGVLYTRLSAKEIERFRPPGDVQVTCDASRCRASWSQPRTWVPLRFLDFHYQLRIRPKHAEDESDAGAQLVNVASPEERSFVFPSPAPRPRQEVRVRAGDVRRPLWSAWSAPAEFGSDAATVTGAAVAVYLAAVLGTIVAALGLGLCFARAVSSLSMLGPVPGIRDKLTEDAGAAVAGNLPVAMATEKHEEEEEAAGDVLTVQEVGAAVQ